nr:secreted protein [Achlya hypogyna]
MKAAFAVVLLMSIFMLSSVMMFSRQDKLAVPPPAAARMRQNDEFRPRELRFLTLADLVRGEICVMASKLFSHGYPMDVLAWNHSTTFFDGTSCGPPCSAEKNGEFRHGQQKKLHWLLHYFVHSPDLHDDDLVLYNDAWDVVVQNDPSVLPHLFLKHTGGVRGVIFNSEPSCGDSFTLPSDYARTLRESFFEVRLDMSYPPRKIRGDNICNLIAAKTAINSKVAGPNWSLGSGGILGDVKSIRAFLLRVDQVRREQEALAATGVSVAFEGDQVAFQLAYVRFPEINAKVDTSGEIFLVVSYLVAEGDLEFFNPKTGCEVGFMKSNRPSTLSWFQGPPVFLHFPGDFKSMFPSCERLAAEHVRDLHPGKYFVDVDRKTKVKIHDVCSNFS